VLFQRGKAILRRQVDFCMLNHLGQKMNKIFLAFISLLLTSCATVPATIKIQDSEVLRGSASGSYVSNTVISVKNIDGLSCKGEMYVSVYSVNTEGTIECNDKRKGNFIANGEGVSWAGEGKLDDGSKFSFIIGPQKTTIKY